MKNSKNFVLKVKKKNIAKFHSLARRKMTKNGSYGNF